MLFSSPRFLLFLAIVLLALWPKYAHATKKRVLSVASCFFYAAWDVRYIGLLLFISVVDWYVANRIAATEDRGTRKRWLLVSLVSNLGLLGYFKYTNFFLGNLNGLLAPFGKSFPHLDILLPAGISFYTFKTLSYTLDVYRGSLPVCRNVLDYAMFVTFFPELIAGPIVRASVFFPQMQRPIGPTRDRLVSGLSLFLLGMTKKRLIADTAAAVADPIFANPGAYDSGALWLGVLAYTIQIYGDFSGYSDMAIGCARMIGYDLPENFAMPYLSQNITEFWRRWHITLSSWLRDYLYIPLGGNRKGPARTYVNLFLTMLLGGLWHGASWNFVLWGGLHGTALAVHKLWTQRVPWRMPPVLGWALTFLFASLCWVPFRAQTFDQTVTMLGRMVGFAGDGYHWVPALAIAAAMVTVAGHAIGSLLASAAEAQRAGRGHPALGLLAALGFRLEVNAVSGWWVVFGAGRLLGVALVAFWLIALFCFARADTSPFIYFQF